MTHPAVDNMGRDTIMRLLANVGSSPEAEPARDCTPFDWREAHYFTPSQLETLREALAVLEPAISQGLEKLCGCEFAVEIAEVTQHHTSAFMKQYSRGEDGTLFQAFGTGAEAALGVIILAAEHARTWVSFLMGSSEGADPDTEMSSFERTLLADVTGTVSRAWSALGDHYAFAPHAEGACEALRVSWSKAGCVCRIHWVLKRKGEEEAEPECSEADFVLPCALLSALADKATRIQQAAPEELSQAMKDHLQDYPVSVRAEVGQTKLSFQAMMQLRVHDVVVLDRSAYEPIDVLVAGRRAFRAALGQSQGQQAVRVTALEATHASNRVT
jgi:flagellar motor switch protein FliM